MAELTKDAQRQQALFEQIDSLEEIATPNEEITSLSKSERKSNPIVWEIMKQVATAIGVNVPSSGDGDTASAANVAN
jgi:Mrp family chromosome partitioning ATPase